MKYLSLLALVLTTLSGCASTKAGIKAFAKGYSDSYNARHTASYAPTTARCYTLGPSTRCELE